MADRYEPPYQAKQDVNQQFTTTAISGTAGTSDTTGTAEVIRLGANPATGALYVQDLAGAAGTSNVAVVSGTQQTLGTVGAVNNIVTGTIAQITTGSIIINNESLGQVMGRVNIIDGGNSVRANVTAGSALFTHPIAGTITRVSNVGTLELGSVVVTSLPSSGTILNLANGTLAVITTVSNLTQGSVLVTSGTLGSVVAVGQVHNAGTIQAGTFQLNAKPVQSVVSHGTLGTAGGSFFATISGASGAGTFHYVTGYSVVVQSGTPDVRILAGTGIQGTGVITAGQFAPNGGIARDLNHPFNAGTGSELVYHFVGAGSAFIQVNYFKTT